MRDVGLFGIQASQVLIRTFTDAVHQPEKHFTWATGTVVTVSTRSGVHGLHPIDLRLEAAAPEALCRHGRVHSTPHDPTPTGPPQSHGVARGRRQIRIPDGPIGGGG